jgi:hypothetical protein
MWQLTGRKKRKKKKKKKFYAVENQLTASLEVWEVPRHGN